MLSLFLNHTQLVLSSPTQIIVNHLNIAQILKTELFPVNKAVSVEENIGLHCLVWDNISKTLI